MNVYTIGKCYALNGGQSTIKVNYSELKVWIPGALILTRDLLVAIFCLLGYIRGCSTYLVCAEACKAREDLRYQLLLYRSIHNNFPNRYVYLSVYLSLYQSARFLAKIFPANSLKFWDILTKFDILTCSSWCIESKQFYDRIPCNGISCKCFYLKTNFNKSLLNPLSDSTFPY